MSHVPGGLVFKRWLNALRGPGVGGGGGAAIAGVGYAYTATPPVGAPDQLDVPAHNAGDFIVCFIKSVATGVTPGLPAGFTDISSSAGVFAVGYRVCYAIDTLNTINNVTSTNAAQMGIAVYSGVSGVGNIGVEPEIIYPMGDPIPFSTLALSAQSWVICWAAINQGGNWLAGNPIGMTQRLVAGVALGSGNASIWDSNGAIGSFTGLEAYTDYAGGFVGQSVSVELLV